MTECEGYVKIFRLHKINQLETTKEIKKLYKLEFKYSKKYFTSCECEVSV